MKLYPHQQEGVAWLARRFAKHKGALLADEMGLGKTAQAIRAVEAMAPDWPNREIMSALVVCPRYLVSTWNAELARWRSSPRVRWDIINYERLTNLVRPDFAVFDEAHYIKTPQAQRSRTAARIAESARWVLAMTGTPMTDRPRDLYHLLSILDPATWAPPNFSRERFETRYCAAWTMRVQGREFRRTDGAANVEELASLLTASVMLRRTKATAGLNLPPKVRSLHLLGRPELQLTLPTAQDDQDDDAVIAEMRKLRASPIAFERWSEEWRARAMRNTRDVAARVRDLLEEGERVLVFAQHRDVAEGIHTAIQNVAHCSRALVNGDTSADERTRIVGQFQAGTLPAVVATLGSLGVGITMTRATVVLFAQVHPSPGVMLQAEDRAHRIGLTHHLNVVYCVEPHTIEARIAAIFARKLDTLQEFGHEL